MVDKRRPAVPGRFCRRSFAREVTGREAALTPKLYIRGVLLFAMLLAGCFYPPPPHALPASNAHLTVGVPYDLAWDAVRQVVTRNNFHIITENPDEGIIEVQAPGAFTLADADCGRLRGIGAKYRAEPGEDASTIYDFVVKPDGNERASVGVQATFSAPLDVPLHPLRGEQCVSRGTQEARLLRAVSNQARNEHRPSFKPPPAPLPARETVE